MRLSSSALSLLINFLLGASWAFVLLGATTLFLNFLHHGFLNALFGAFLGAFPGLLFVLFIEYFIMQSDKFKEITKQTKLLEKIAKKE